MWIFLITDAMTFGGLLIGYGILRAGNTQWPTPSSILGIRFTAVMTFGGLLIAYGILRAGNKSWPTPSQVLGIQFTALMTFVLICSSLTMVLGLDAAKRGLRREAVKWLLAPAGGGLFFLLGQVYEYSHLIHEGFTLPSGNFPATFFVVTSFHGMHVFTGVCYLLITAAGVARGKFLDRGANFVEITGLFWHFVDLIWILVFTFIYLL
jgi:heme/copper-type cytochrome/quinol oxidase subunit 3